jgi:hypothetical protein
MLWWLAAMVVVVAVVTIAVSFQRARGSVRGLLTRELNGEVIRSGFANCVGRDDLDVGSLKGYGGLGLSAGELRFVRRDQSWAIPLSAISGAQASTTFVGSGVSRAMRRPMLVVSWSEGGGPHRIAFMVESAGDWVGAIGSARLAR